MGKPGKLGNLREFRIRYRFSAKPAERRTMAVAEEVEMTGEQAYAILNERPELTVYIWAMYHEMNSEYVEISKGQAMRTLRELPNSLFLVSLGARTMFLG